MFDIKYFYNNPKPFYKFAKEIFPGLYQPSPCHKFIRLIEKMGKLLRNYTQNIDTLERIANIQNIIECHGSFVTATCTKCKLTVKSDDIHSTIMKQKIPLCQICNKDIIDMPNATNTNDNLYETNQLYDMGIMKPDIIFFGENLGEKFHQTIENDLNQCDLLIVIGSSLKVKPVALIPNALTDNIPQIIINREHLDNFVFDVEMLGDADIIINQLCYM